MKGILPLFPLLVVFLYVGCDQKDEPTTTSRQTFEVRGVIQAIRQEGKVLIIDHEEIPGYMRQMIMPFGVAEGESTSGLTPGEEIEFVYEVEEVKSWIHSIRKTGVTRDVKIASADELPDPEDVELLEIGDVFPDYEFKDQDGTEISLDEYRGRPVALTFVFSRCPVPEYCPAMMRNFNEIEERLKSDPDSPADWKLLTISFDSWNDSPEIMKAYGEAYGRDTANWSLLSTESCCTIYDISGNVGLKFADQEGSFIHNLRTVVLDRDGRIVRIFTDESWEIEELISEIKALG